MKVVYLVVTWLISLLMQFILSQLLEREGMTGSLLSGAGARSWAGVSLMLLLLLRLLCVVVLPGLIVAFLTRTVALRILDSGERKRAQQAGRPNV
jgi:hypothetical protein